MTALKATLNKRTLGIAAIVSLLPLTLTAQGPGGGRGGAPPANAKAAAPIDFTGQWVSLITEDWRYRMVTPAKGDYASVPLTAAARKVADAWDPVKDEAAKLECKSYGAAGLMRVPTRIRISWADDDTMKLETDAGMQARSFYFKEPKTQGGDWQGLSQASWEMTSGYNFMSTISGSGRRAQQPDSSFKVVTTKMKPGYLRKNGIPYSDKAVMTEYFDRTIEANGDSWLVVTSIVDDPMYLNQPFVTSAHFRKENDQSKWSPAPCSAR